MDTMNNVNWWKVLEKLSYYTGIIAIVVGIIGLLLGMGISSIANIIQGILMLLIYRTIK